jgi:hypothetical protein
MLKNGAGGGVRTHALMEEGKDGRHWMKLSNQ